MSVSTVRMQDGRRVRASSPAGGPARLRTGWSRAIFTVGASATVGIAAGLGTKTAVAALLGVAVVVITLVRPVIAAYTLVAVVPPVSGLRAGLPVPQLRPAEVLIASIGVLLLLLARPGQTPRWRAFDWLAFGYAVANAGLGAADLLSQGSPIAIGQADKLLGPMQFFILYRAVLTTLRTKRQRRVALRLLLFGSIPVSLLAILQEVHVPRIAALLASATDSQLFLTTTGVSRATGPFAIWHDLGSYLFVIVLVGVALLVNQSYRVMKPRTLTWIVVLAGIALICTVTITPIAGTAAGVLVLAVTARPRRQWVTRTAAFIVLLSVAFGPILDARYKQQYVLQAPIKQLPYLPETINFRIAVWTTEYIPVLVHHLVTGYGPDNPPNLAFSYTESVYVTLLLRGGLPLLLLYAGLMLTLAFRARDLRNDPDLERRVVAQVLFLLIVLVVFMQMTTNYFVNAGFPFAFWVLAGLLGADGAAGTGRLGAVLAGAGARRSAPGDRQPGRQLDLPLRPSGPGGPENVMTRVVVVGDLMTDVVAHVLYPLARSSDTPAAVSMHGGGSGANIAAWLAVDGIDVAFVGRRGADIAGRNRDMELMGYGVDARLGLDPERPTGTCVVLTTHQGEHTMLSDPGANAALSPDDLPPDLFAPGNHLHVSGYTLLSEGARPAALAAIQDSVQAGMTVSVDAASAAPLERVGAELFLELSNGATLLFVNEAEGRVLTGRDDAEQAARALAARYPQVVVKMGANGAMFHANGRPPVRVPAPPIDRIVDGTGAGDAFSGGFLGPWLDKKPPGEALASGCRLAAHAMNLVGARPVLSSAGSRAVGPNHGGQRYPGDR